MRGCSRTIRHVSQGEERGEAKSRTARGSCISLSLVPGKKYKEKSNGVGELDTRCENKAKVAFQEVGIILHNPNSVFKRVEF